MQNKCFLLMTFAITALLPKYATADIYLGASLNNSFVDLKDNSNKKIYNGENILFQPQMGFFFNNYLGMELRYGTAIRRQDRLLMDSLFSGYLKGNIPINSRTAVYGLLGQSYIQLDGIDFDEIKETGMSFGIGAHYAINSTTALFAEFTNTDFSIDSLQFDSMLLKNLSLGFQYRF